MTELSVLKDRDMDKYFQVEVIIDTGRTNTIIDKYLLSRVKHRKLPKTITFSLAGEKGIVGRLVSINTLYLGGLTIHDVIMVAIQARN